MSAIVNERKDKERDDACAPCTQCRRSANERSIDVGEVDLLLENEAANVVDKVDRNELARRVASESRVAPRVDDAHELRVATRQQRWIVDG